MSNKNLYLLVNTTGDAFKIGISCNTMQRISAIPVEIDLNRSLEVTMQEGSAYKIEQMLHYLFRDNNHSMPQGDGYTEWFSIDVWDDVLQFLVEQTARLGIGKPQPISNTEAHRRAEADAANKEKKRREDEKISAFRKEILAKRSEALEVHNREAVRSFYSLFSEMVLADAVAGILIDDDATDGEPVLYLTGDYDNLVKWTRNHIQLFSGRHAVGENIFSSTWHINKVARVKLGFGSHLFNGGATYDLERHLEDIKMLLEPWMVEGGTRQHSYLVEVENYFMDSTKGYSRIIP